MVIKRSPSGPKAAALPTSRRSHNLEVCALQSGIVGTSGPVRTFDPQDKNGQWSRDGLVQKHLNLEEPDREEESVRNPLLGGIVEVPLSKESSPLPLLWSALRRERGPNARRGRLSPSGCSSGLSCMTNRITVTDSAELVLLLSQPRGSGSGSNGCWCPVQGSEFCPSLYFLKGSIYFSRMFHFFFFLFFKRKMLSNWTSERTTASDLHHNVFHCSSDR